MRLKFAAASALATSAAGCMTYRGPVGVEAMIERKAQVELHREVGFKLGWLTTKIATSIMHGDDDDSDLRELRGIGVVVFDVTRRTGDRAQPITAADLGFEGWRPVIQSRSEGEQLLVLAKAGDEQIKEMIFLSIDGDEVVIARLKGDLDRLTAKTIDAAHRDGARGARAAIGAGAVTP